MARMSKGHRAAIKRHRKRLRCNMTKAERKLWFRLREEFPLRPRSWRPQKIMERYIVDFYSTRARIAIEVDGKYHEDPEQMEKDAARQEYITNRGKGNVVLRYTNDEVLYDLDRVIEEIKVVFYQRINEIENETNVKLSYSDEELTEMLADSV